MPIWCHLVLSGLVTFAGAIIAFSLTAVAYFAAPRLPWVWPDRLLGAAVVFTLTFVGLHLSEWLVRRVAARCPECRGRAYAEGHRPIRYRCRHCGHLLRTRVKTNWGND